MQYAKEFAWIFLTTAVAIFVIRRVIVPAVPQVNLLLGGSAPMTAGLTTAAPANVGASLLP